MTDEWARPSAHRSEPIGNDPEWIEIFLDGDGDGEGSQRRPNTGGPKWRRLIAVSSVCGAILGIAVGVAVVTGGDDDPQPAPTTVDPVQLASDITAPPTLAPLETIARPDVFEAQPPTSPALPGLPEYPAAEVSPEVLAGFDLFGAASRIGTGVARHSHTDYRIGSNGYRLAVDIINDPVSGRYRIDLELNDEHQTLVIDVTGGSTYYDIGDGSGTFRRLDNDEIAAGTGSASMDEFASQLQLGPIRPDTIGVVKVTPGEVVSIDGGSPARRFTVTVPATAIPEWARYRFGPVNETAPVSAGEVVTYAVYVTSDGRIQQVDGVAAFGNTVQTVSHSIEVLADPPAIGLPDPASVLSPTTVAPAATPPTTTPATTPFGTEGTIPTSTEPG